MDLKKISLEIRDIISEYQKKHSLSFIEDTHTYFIKNEKGDITSDMPSVSSVLKAFYNHFDSVSTKSFEKCGGDRELERTLLTEWNYKSSYATNMGSRVHYILEKELVSQYGSYKEVRQPIFECDDEQIATGDAMITAGKNFLELMHQRGAVLLDTEIVLGSLGLGYFGQPDKVWLMLDKKGDIGIVITDWKGLPVDTPILTTEGWKTMGSLTTEDKVFDRDGNGVNIKNISKIKNKKCLKIKFDNNDEIVSDFEHRWLVFTEKLGVKTEKIMTTQEIKDYYDNLNRRYSHKILKIDNAKPLNNNKLNLPIDPYVLGVWLGDGHSIDTKITQANLNVWEEIRKRGYEIGSDISGGSSGKATTRTVFNIRKEFDKLNLLKNKHLPDIYLLSSFSQRLDLLRGLMDSDGYFHKKRNRFVISTTRKNQIEFSVKILSSLGIKASVLNYNKKFNNKIIKCYNIEFKTDKFNPFLSRNEDINLIIKKNKSTFRNIKTVEYTDSVPTKCIEVDSPTSTFLCGHNLLVTHNTNKVKNFEVHNYTKLMLQPFNGLWDNALSHYKLQLPLYAKLLLHMLKDTKYSDIKFLGCVIVHLTSEATFTEYRVTNDIVNTIMDMDVKKFLAERADHIKKHKFLEQRDKEIINS